MVSNTKNIFYYVTNAKQSMPKMIYGTAWKKEKTKDLVLEAIKNGFRGIDTACQPKHYREDLVGEAVNEAIKNNLITRKDLFLQTKFTSLDGQDPKNIPYNKNSKLEDQVNESVKKSLENLKVDYIDSLLLHSPMKSLKDTIIVYNVLEEYVEKGIIKQLGISNIYDCSELKSIYDAVKIKPSVVQNRFYSDSSYDVELRKFCNSKQIIYQSFWTLTANPNFLKGKLFSELASQMRVSTEQIMYKLVIQLGIAPLNGTTNVKHMEEDLKVLSIEDIEDKKVEQFKKLIGDI